MLVAFFTLKHNETQRKDVKWLNLIVVQILLRYLQNGNVLNVEEIVLLEIMKRERAWRERLHRMWICNRRKNGG
jgi:hypothetical protein